MDINSQYGLQSAGNCNRIRHSSKSIGPSNSWQVLRSHSISRNLELFVKRPKVPGVQRVIYRKTVIDLPRELFTSAIEEFVPSIAKIREKNGHARHKRLTVLRTMRLSIPSEMFAFVIIHFQRRDFSQKFQRWKTALISPEVLLRV